MRVVQTFSSTVTYGPFTHDYIHFCDLTFSGKPRTFMLRSSLAPRENSRPRNPLLPVSSQLLPREAILKEVFDRYKVYTY